MKTACWLFKFEKKSVSAEEKKMFYGETIQLLTL